MATSQSNCIGREQELTQLEAAFRETLLGNGKVMSITGHPGTGKSTLLHEFMDRSKRSKQDLVSAWGLCDSQASNTPLLPWKELLESLAGVSEVEVAVDIKPGKGVFESTRSAVVELAPDLIDLLVPGIGLVMRATKMLSQRTALGTRLLHNRSRDQFVERKVLDADKSLLQEQYISLLERLSEDTPLILIIEDLHWADHASVDLLQRLIARVSNRHIMVVCTFRTHESLGDNNALANHHSINLDVKLPTDAVSFVKAYVQAKLPGIGNRFIKDLTRHTGGHPLFVTELVHHLMSDGTLVQNDGLWTLSGPIYWASLPTKVEEVLDKELQNMSKELLHVLSAGSVEGDQFTIELIAPLTDQSPLQLVRLLGEKEAEHLVEPVGAARIGTKRVTHYRFRHHVVRNYVYQQIDTVECQYLHEAIAEKLESLALENLDEFAASLAFHFDAAEDTSRACDYYKRAAEMAFSVCGLVESLSHLKRALELDESESIERLQVLRDICRSQNLAGQLQEANVTIDQAIQLAEVCAADDLAIILCEKSNILTHMNKLNDAGIVAQRALDLAGGQGTDLVTARCLLELADISNKKGTYETTLQLLNRAHEIHSNHLSETDQIFIITLTALGWCLKELGQLDESLVLLTEGLDIQDRLGNPNLSTYATTSNALADLHLNLNNYDKAHYYFEQAIDCWGRFDRHVNAGIALGNMANLANRQKRFDEALEYASRGLRIDESMLGVDHPDIAFPLTCVGESCIGLKSYEDAIKVLERAFQLRTDNDVPPGNLAWTQWLLGRALVESDRNISLGYQYIKQARVILQILGDATVDELKDVESWLAENIS